jgi:hypothetical protein
MIQRSRTPPPDPKPINVITPRFHARRHIQAKNLSAWADKQAVDFQNEVKFKKMRASQLLKKESVHSHTLGSSVRSTSIANQSTTSTVVISARSRAKEFYNVAVKRKEAIR